MTRGEALIAVAMAILLVTAGLTWLFGPYGLIGCGAVLLVAVLVIADEKKE